MRLRHEPVTADQTLFSGQGTAVRPLFSWAGFGSGSGSAGCRSCVPGGLADDSLGATARHAVKRGTKILRSAGTVSGREPS